MNRNRRPLNRPSSLALAVALGLLCCAAGAEPARAADPPEDHASIEEMKALSLEDLLEVEIVSVSKKSEPFARAAAAVHVITAEQIRRSGASSLPDALRMVPGLQVARLDSSRWAISARGFNGMFANKLLVMIDGRSIYTPLFSGVFWDDQDIMLEDIERIEVIRGPGGTLWGANAVNGIINIITKKSADTTGTMLTTKFGTVDPRAYTAIRHGAEVGESGAYRVYAKYSDRGPLEEPAGQVDRSNDDVRGGFRFDLGQESGDSVTIQGEYARTDYEQTFESVVAAPALAQRIDYDNHYEGAHLMARWTRTVSANSELSLKAYYDDVDRVYGDFADRTRTYDVDLQQRLDVGERQNLVWGVGYRRVNNHLPPTLTVIPEDPDWSLNLWSAFAQDEISLHDDSVRLIVGAKLEDNDLTGLELQPSVRMAWHLGERQTLWAAASRAIRTPDRQTDDPRINFAVYPPAPPMIPLPVLVSTFGNPDLEAESVNAFEIGYRDQPTSSFSVDLALYYNSYHNLVSLYFADPVPEFDSLPPHLLIQIDYGNDGAADTYGGELSVQYTPSASWRLSGGYTHHHYDGKIANVVLGEGRDPSHRAFLRTSWNPGARWECDAALRWVGQLDGFQVLDSPPTRVDSYITADLRVAWRPTKRLEVELVGTNLLEGDHYEFREFFFRAVSAQVPASAYVGLTWAF